MASHCLDDCCCQPLFEKTRVIVAHPNEGTRIIIEAAAIAKGSCISKPSIFLSEKELAYLDSSARGVLG